MLSEKRSNRHTNITGTGSRNFIDLFHAVFSSSHSILKRQQANNRSLGTLYRRLVLILCFILMTFLLEEHTIAKTFCPYVQKFHFSCIFSANKTYITLPQKSFHSPLPSKHTLIVLRMIFQSLRKLRSFTYFTSRSIHSSNVSSLRCGAICQ